VDVRNVVDCRWNYTGLCSVQTFGLFVLDVRSLVCRILDASWRMVVTFLPIKICDQCFYIRCVRIVYVNILYAVLDEVL
jgi:hypothetical protein